MGKYDSFLANASRSQRFSLYPIITPARKKDVPQKEQLINHWTKSLDDNAEQQLHAMGMLHEVIDPDSADLPKNLNALTEVTPTQQTHRARSLLFCAGLAGILFALIAWKTWQIYPSLRFLWNESNWYFAEAPAVTTNSPEENFLLYGDTTRNGKASQMRALWERDPNNPANYAEYCWYYFQEKGDVPEGFLEITKRIDPDNGWFTYLAACATAANATKTGDELQPRAIFTPKKSISTTTKNQLFLAYQGIYQKTIMDDQKAKKALALWRKSLHQPTFESYASDIYRKRFSLLSNSGSLQEVISNRCYINSVNVDWLPNFFISNIIAAYLQSDNLSSLEKENLMRDVDFQILYDKKRSKESLRKPSLWHHFAIATSLQIKIMNTNQIDTNLVNEWMSRANSIDQYDINRFKASETFKRGDASEGWQKASYFSGNMQWHNHLLLAPITPSPTELAPLRYAEHSFTMRIVAIFFSLLFLLFFPFNLTFRRRKPLLRLGAEVWPAIPWSSHAKLFFWSVLLPMAYFASLYWFTPFAGKDTGIKEMFLVPYVPAACVGLIMLILPRILIHRTTKHWEMMGQQKKNWSLGIGWLCVVLALIPMHALTFKVFTELSYDMLYTVIGCCMIPSLLWLLMNGLRERFSRQPYRRVMHALRRTMLLPCSAASLVVLFCTIFALQSMETYWVKKDTLLALSPDAMTGGFEARVMKALDHEQRQALGIEHE